MSQFWSPVVHNLIPYVPGEQPASHDDLVKLNTNENPYGPSPRALDAISKAVTDALRLYPDPTASQLRATIAESHGISPDQVFVGNGSDEVLAHAFQALLNHDAPLLFPDITYASTRPIAAFTVSTIGKCPLMRACKFESRITSSPAARSFCRIRMRRQAAP